GAYAEQITWIRSTARIVARNYCTIAKNARNLSTYRRNSVEPAGLRTPIIKLRHITSTRAKHNLSPNIIATQVARAIKF
ncbi:MAG: hypothetical protein ACXACA_04645, partial [Candidatus Ranarchaeia archaeon]